MIGLIKVFYCITAEAEKEYGADKIKIYKSTFTPMYYAMTEHKAKCSMKLICLLPDEKVILYLYRIVREHSGSVVECLARDPGAPGSSLTASLRYVLEQGTLILA